MSQQLPSTVQEIKNSLGWWRVLFRPVRYPDQALSVQAMKDLLRTHQVALRGWNFPHFKEQEWVTTPTYIEHKTDVNIFCRRVEFFRFFASGQFIYYSTLREDGRVGVGNTNSETPGELGLEMTGANWTITEFFEFAARLSGAGVFGEALEYEIQLHGTNGRRLFTDDFNRMLSDYFVCKSDQLVFTESIGAAELFERRHTLALQKTRELYGCFDLEQIKESMLEQDQKRLLERRF